VTLSEADIAAVIALLRHVSQTEILIRFKQLSAGDVRTKSGPLDPVTVADEAAEIALTAGLRTLFPAADFLGEEAVSADVSRLDRLKQPGPVWIIDPIDGTANYAADLPLFGVMLALVEADEVLAGFIHDPICDDTAVAIAGGDAWMVRQDGSRHDLHVALPVSLDRMIGSVSWRYLPADLKLRVLNRLPLLGSTCELRCAAHSYRALAAGHIHMGLFWRLYPWDHAAGFLLHKEAGGYARHFDGSTYHPSHIDGGLLLAPDAASWQALHEALLE